MTIARRLLLEESVVAQVIQEVLDRSHRVAQSGGLLLYDRGDSSWGEVDQVKHELIRALGLDGPARVGRGLVDRPCRVEVLRLVAPLPEALGSGRRECAGLRLEGRVRDVGRDAMAAAPVGAGASISGHRGSLMAIRRTLAAVFLGGSVAATAVLAGAASPAVADTLPFVYTGGEQIFNLPHGVTRIHVVAVGGHGGAASGGIVPGGAAAVVTTDFSVPPGTTRLFIEVGGAGVNEFNAPETTDGNGGLGGFNGGGPGGANVDYPQDPTSMAGGGGGASDVRTCSRAAPACGASATSLSSRLVVAAGGGGAGAGGGAPSTFPDTFAPGGDGGLTGQSGGTGFSPPNRGGGGAGLTAGGAGGTRGVGPPFSGGPGGLGIGGAGGRISGGLREFSLGGGGGGGGLFGGGGGTEGGNLVFRSPGGGGGGSSLVPPGGSVAVDTTGVPSVTLTFTVPPPGTETTPLGSGHTPSASAPAGRLAATGGTGNGGTLGLVLLLLGGCGVRLARRREPIAR